MGLVHVLFISSIDNDRDEGTMQVNYGPRDVRLPICLRIRMKSKFPIEHPFASHKTFGFVGPIKGSHPPQLTNNNNKKKRQQNYTPPFSNPFPFVDAVFCFVFFSYDNLRY